MASPKTYSASDIDLLEQRARHQARSDYWLYRQYMNPGMKKGWFQRDVSGHLMQWYEQFLAGERPKLILCSPPQHGKSEMIVDFISWLAGRNPDWKTIFGSFSDYLGIRANHRLQRTYDGGRYQALFPETRINTSSAVTPSGKALRNKTILQYDGYDGYFRNTTVQGSVTGESLDIGIIDDPIKGAAEARSPANRENAWAWFVDDFLSRFSDEAGMIMILTRWHLDDPAGRLIDSDPSVKVVWYPAVAEPGVGLMDDDPREPGSNEVLFPEHKSYDFLMERRSVSTEQSWQSIYQQSPIISGGGIFPGDRFDVVESSPSKQQIVSTIRYWDKAGTKDGGARTAGVLMHRLKDGRYFVEDVKCGQWGALDRESHIKQTAKVDGKNTVIWVEQEPGSGGKESAENTIRGLPGFKVYADRVTGDKETRAEPYAAQVQGGNVLILRSAWNRSFIDEHEAFPNGTYKDQVDAAAGVFAKLSGQYLNIGAWV